MRYRSFEANYLISLISSTINQRIPTNPVRAMEWRELFYLAEYHDVTNLAYYALLGLYDQVPETWRGRFSKIFRKWVTVDSAQEKGIQAVMDSLEDHQVDYMLMKDWVLKRYYPQPDMRATEDIDILVKQKDEKTIKKMMKDLGYHHEQMDEHGSIAFYKTVRCRIVFHQKLFPDNRKLRPYFSKIWKRAKSAVGYGSRFALGVDDFYIYMIAATCHAYALGEVDARHIMDIHLYLRKNREFMDQNYIESELGNLELYKLTRCLEDVGDLWLGVYEGDDPRGCKDVEEYIWSKGSYGRETSIRLLPMITDMKIWLIEDERKRSIIKVTQWFFPKSETMKNRFPSLSKFPFLLPFYWIVRLLTVGGFYIKIKMTTLHRFLVLKIDDKMSKRKKPEKLPEDPK